MAHSTMALRALQTCMVASLLTAACGGSTGTIADGGSTSPDLAAPDGGTASPMLLAGDAHGIASLVAGPGGEYFSTTCCSEGPDPTPIRWLPSDGRPETSLGSFRTPRVQLDATHLYYAYGSGSSSTSRACSLALSDFDGSGFSTLRTSPTGCGRGFAAANGVAYWVEIDAAGMNHLVAVPANGQAVTPLVSSSESVIHLAIAGSGLFRTLASAAFSPPTRLVRRDLMSDVETVVLDGTPLHAMAGFAGGVAVIAGTQVLLVSADGKATTPLANLVLSPPDSDSISVDATRVVWADGQALSSVPLAGGVPTTIPHGCISAPLTALDAAAAYTGCSPSGEVWRWPR